MRQRCRRLKKFGAEAKVVGGWHRLVLVFEGGVERGCRRRRLASASCRASDAGGEGGTPATSLRVIDGVLRHWFCTRIQASSSAGVGAPAERGGKGKGVFLQKKDVERDNSAPPIGGPSEASLRSRSVRRARH